MKRYALFGLAVALIAGSSLGAPPMKIITFESAGQQIEEFIRLNPMFKKALVGQCIIMSTPGAYCFAKGKAESTFWRAFTPLAPTFPSEELGGESFIQLFRVDCQNYRVRQLKATRYSEPNLRGKRSYIEKPSGWIYPEPDALDMTTGMDAICVK